MGVDVIAAGKGIDGGVAQLGPRMDRQMRLGEDRHPRKAVGLKPVDVDAQERGTRPAGRFGEEPLEKRLVIDRLPIAEGEVGQHLSSQLMSQRKHLLPLLPSFPPVVLFMRAGWGAGTYHRLGRSMPRRAPCPP